MKNDYINIDFLDYDLVSMGMRIRKRREEMGYKQKDIAEKLNVSNNHISYIETGKAAPSIKVFLGLCHILNADPDYFLLGIFHGNNLPEKIYDKLKLCSDEELRILDYIVEGFIQSKY